MGKSRIVEEIARKRIVEEMVKNISGKNSLHGDLLDLCQEIYLILLEYDDDKIVDLWENGEIRFFIARVITNQLISVTSPFYTKYRKFRKLIDPSVETFNRSQVSREELNILETLRVIDYEK